jgi:hypothetical protein
VTEEELLAYAEVARMVEVEGDIVECGVYMGDTLMTIAQTLPGRRVWAYDSFQGFPPGTPGKDDDVALGLVGAVAGDPDVVRSKVEPHASELTIVEGWFEDTLRDPLCLEYPALPENIAFLSLDCDLYASVRLALEVLAPRVVRGGIITLDDWSTFVGCRRGFYDADIDGLRAVDMRYFGPCRAAWLRVT